MSHSHTCSLIKNEIYIKSLCQDVLLYSYHLVARAKACVNDYRAALTAEKTAFAIYNSKVFSCGQLMLLIFTFW